jgi:nucleotide-binding universal stress UspA family protein
LTFRKILFPVDYSEPCKAIVPYVQDIVRHYSAELTVVHAYGLGVIAPPVFDPSFLGRARAFEEKRLQHFAFESFPDQPVEPITELNEPATAICNVIQHRAINLVMLPTRGPGPLRRLLLGSVTAKVLHDVSAPVWTGTGSALSGHKPRVPYKAVVCALNGSAEDATTLRAAHSFAASYQAHLSLVRVVEMKLSKMDIDNTPFMQETMDAADRQLQELKGSLGIDAQHSVIETKVAEGVAQIALRAKADLIITGRGHARDRVSRIWANLYEIVRESPCPVLSV